MTITIVFSIVTTHFMAEKKLRSGAEFFELGDRNIYAPLHIIQVLDGPLVVEKTTRKGGPTGNSIGWRVCRGRVLVQRIGRDGRFAFPPDALPHTIFIKS